MWYFLPENKIKKNKIKNKVTQAPLKQLSFERNDNKTLVVIHKICPIV